MTKRTLLAFLNELCVRLAIVANDGSVFKKKLNNQGTIMKSKQNLLVSRWPHNAQGWVASSVKDSAQRSLLCHELSAFQEENEGMDIDLVRIAYSSNSQLLGHTPHWWLANAKNALLKHLWKKIECCVLMKYLILSLLVDYTSKTYKWCLSFSEYK